eukprot:CAMPEP_0178446626 /NCGR_PEP_ID=MMETSP0689_2-20121128/40916_1 /TAXON_ID=160604 /ORGANISM="Amphidinium massartii, Strain CS-259" /LENGTH=996 /DNA_ID=CAMNT_0020071487 /DNA_START=155 /DNA_END=3145 /DNA_ORIENTATION=+
MKEQEDAWLVMEADATKTFKAVEDATDQVERLGWIAPDCGTPCNGLRRLDEDQEQLGRSRHGSPSEIDMSGFIRESASHSDHDFGFTRRLQPQNDDFGEAYVFYKIDGGNVFSPAALAKMCELEILAAERVLSVGDTAFTSIDTSLRFFYGSPVLADGTSAASYFHQDNAFFTGLMANGCHELDQAHVDEVALSIAQDVAANLTSSVYARYVTASFYDTFTASQQLANPITTTKISGATDMLDDLMEDFTDKVGLEYGLFTGLDKGSISTSAYQGDEDRFTEFGPVRIRFYYANLNEEFMIGVDLGMSLVSFIIVFSVLWIYTKSLFLASSGMLQIVLSLPVSGLFYRGVFQIKYFHFLHVLVVYLVLGIGADDIFVLVDTFIHLEREQAAKYPAWSQGRFKAAFKNAYVRTAGSIFNTSFTTAMAFMSSSGSKAMPMRTCGWFAAICILMNYVFTMTFTPAALAIWHYRFQGKGCCRCCNFSERAEGTGDDKDAAEPSLGCLEKALHYGYVPFMSKKVGPIRPGALGVLVLGIAIAFQGVYFTGQLTPPRKPEVWIPDTHMARDIQAFFPKASFSPDFEVYEIVSMIWGIQDLDTSTLDVYEPDDFQGGAVFDGGFDPSTVEAQQAIKDACVAFRTKTCSLPGCENAGSGLFRMDAADQEWSCFMEDFHVWLAYHLPNFRVDDASTWLTGPDFMAELWKFRENNGQYSWEETGCCVDSLILEKNYYEDIGFIDGNLKYVQVRVRSSLNEDLSFSDGIDVRDMMDSFIDQQRALMPPELQSLKYHGNGLFARWDLGEELLNGFFQSLAIASPVAFVVLLVSTWNIIVSLFALVSVGSVVVCVLGWCRAVMDWDLGIGEAIAGVIVLGYSVDYVVHLAHIYCEAAQHGKSTRDERARYAIENMGTTIFAGAITTGGSGLVMFFCFFSFFFKMAVLITITIMYAFFFSLGFMMSLLWTIGPEGRCGDIVQLCCRCLANEPQTSKGVSDSKDGKPTTTA